MQIYGTDDRISNKSHFNYVKQSYCKYTALDALSYLDYAAVYSPIIDMFWQHLINVAFVSNINLDFIKDVY